ncbi:MAG: efflux RND transporter periplasmic adaptor subunit [Ignavibacteriae bacterium]|nr:MAG: efflux RND transporter periplasmic adaptor subunit [Ignavibacteriota bacterium]
MKKILIILFTALIISGCKNNGNDSHKEEGHEQHEEENKELVILSKESQETIKLETEIAREEEYKGYIKIPAVIVTDQNYEAQVGPIVSGKVKKVYASVGTHVKAGQVLMLIEGLEIGVLKADFLKAKTTLDFTEQEYERQKSLSELNAGSQKNLNSSRAEYEKALAEFNAMDKKIHSIGLKDSDVINSKNDLHSAGDLAVRAPISGVIVERNVVAGQFLESSSIGFKILNTSSLLVDGQVYENDYKNLRNVSSAEFITSSLPGVVFPCTITYKGGMIDEKTRTIKIIAKVNNNQNILLPQMFGELQIPAGETSVGIFVPSESIVRIDNQDFIFVQSDDTTYLKKAVTTGSNFKDKIEIKEGLEAGERFVIKGTFYLKSELMKESIEEHGH